MTLALLESRARATRKRRRVALCTATLLFVAALVGACWP